MNYNSDEVIVEGDNYLHELPTIKKIERSGCDGISDLPQMVREYYWVIWRKISKKLWIIYKHIKQEKVLSNLLKKCLCLKTGLEYRLSKKKG